MTATVTQPAHYICPGQQYSISPAVHRARMAIAYDGCRDCPYNERKQLSGSSSSTLPPATLATLPSHISRLLTRDGIRGVFRNDLTLSDVRRICAALAAELWNAAELTRLPMPPDGFPVVVGYDERPWSPYIAAAAGEALRLAGCETIDVGLVTGPAFRFAVNHLDAAAGVLATGAGGAPAIAGLDFVSKGGRPLSAEGSLDRLLTAAPGRPTRRGGGLRQFNANAVYESRLKTHFKAAASQLAVVATSSSLIRRRLQWMASENWLNLHLADIVRHPGTVAEIKSEDLIEIAAAVRQRQANFGLWIDEDGTASRIIDERGRLLSIAAVAALLIEKMLATNARGTVVVDWALADQLSDTVLRRREHTRSSGSAESMAISMTDHAAVVGFDSDGRHWTAGPPAACDALVTLAKLLDVCGQSEMTLSARINQLQTRH